MFYNRGLISVLMRPATPQITISMYTNTHTQTYMHFEWESERGEHIYTNTIKEKTTTILIIYLSFLLGYIYIS